MDGDGRKMKGNERKMKGNERKLNGNSLPLHTFNLKSPLREFEITGGCGAECGQTPHQMLIPAKFQGN